MRNKMKFLPFLLGILLLCSGIALLFVPQHSIKQKEENVEKIDTKEEFLHYLETFYKNEDCSFEYIGRTKSEIQFECDNGESVINYFYNIKEQEMVVSTSGITQVTSNL